MKVHKLTTTYHLQQLISDCTHIFPNTSTCIDLIFTDQPNLVVDNDGHPSLHTNCHHQITYCKFKLITESPPPYQRFVWDYKRANINSIRQALCQVNRSTILSSKHVHQQVNILNSILINVFTNYVSNKAIKTDEKDPHWMTEFLKSNIQWQNSISKLFRIVPRILQNTIQCNRLLYRHMRKRMILFNTLAIKLLDLTTSSKSYYSILKTFIMPKRCL